MRKPMKPRPEETPNAPRRGGRPEPTRDLLAEQCRESLERAEARDAEASIRDHMVDIGRGNQQAGR